VAAQLAASQEGLISISKGKLENRCNIFIKINTTAIHDTQVLSF
jgi:hypothetical protein